MYRGVLFDWDGTLADTRKVILKSFQHALKTVVNVEADPEFIERQIGTGAAQTFKTILTKAGKAHDNTTVKQLIAAKVRTETELTSQVQLFQGARELLEALQGKVKLALASMNNRAVIEDLLRALAIEKCFDTVVAVEEVQKFKPDPEIFLKAAANLQLKPVECVVLEDSIFGVQAAKNAGIACIAVLTGVYGKAELEKANPELIVNSLCEKEKILTFIEL
jgi:HAD superfamily hydrolase (TIGR01509 family)